MAAVMLTPSSGGTCKPRRSMAWTVGDMLKLYTNSFCFSLCIPWWFFLLVLVCHQKQGDSWPNEVWPLWFSHAKWPYFLVVFDNLSEILSNCISSRLLWFYLIPSDDQAQSGGSSIKRQAQLCWHLPTRQGKIHPCRARGFLHLGAHRP